MRGVSCVGGAAKTRRVEGAAPSPLAARAVNPSLGARWRHSCRHTVPQPARTPHQTVGRRSFESCLSCGVHQTWSRYVMSVRRIQHRSYRAHRPFRLALARLPSRDLERHGCRAGAYMDVLAACPAMVGGQGPCSQAAHRMLRLRPCLCLYLIHIPRPRLRPRPRPRRWPGSGAIRDLALFHQGQIVHADIFGVVQPGTDLQIVHRMFQAHRHADATGRIGHHPLLGQHHLAL